jgi:trans-2,3-dihydro-3-hydroxyanthranilate isomerase
MASVVFTTYDVFTGRRFAGNPLAVVEGADGLSLAAMQVIAREFNLSETIFLLPPENPAHTARVRIFTPVHEMPFAGHPTVGGAIHLARSRFGDGADLDAVIVLEEIVGPVRCAVQLKTGRAAFAEFDAPRLAEEIGAAAGDDLIARALDLDPRQIGFDHHRPSRFSAGAPFVFAPLRDLAALRQARPTLVLDDVLEGAVGIVAYTRLGGDDPQAFQVRMFAPAAGVVEDPATGSAAAAMAGVVARFEGLADGAHQLPIAQGVEMGRPSVIAVDVTIAHGVLSGCRIGGEAVKVSAGTMEIDGLESLTPRS